MVHCQLFNIEVTKGEIKTKNNRCRKIAKMLDVKSTLTVITLDVCGLNTNFKAEIGKRI